MISKTTKKRIELRGYMDKECNDLVMAIGKLDELCSQAKNKDDFHLLIDDIKDLTIYCERYDKKYIEYTDMRMNCLGHDGNEVYIIKLETNHIVHISSLKPAT